MTEIRCINRSGNIIFSEKKNKVVAESKWNRIYWATGWEIFYYKHSLITWNALLERLRQKYPEDFIEMEQIQGTQKYENHFDVKPLFVDFDINEL